MPKKSKLRDSNNVPNPLAIRTSSIKPDPDETLKRKGRVAISVPVIVTQEEMDAEPVKTEVKEEPNFNLYVGTELGILKG